MNSTDSVIPAWQYTLVSSVIFVIGGLGVCWNTLAIVVVWKNPILKNSFGLLCVSHSIANIGVLIVFLSWCGPSTVMKHDSDISTSLLGKRLGQINIFFWDACVYSHLAISINRLITMSFQQKASTILSIKNTCFVLMVVWMLGVAHAVPYFRTEDCFIVYTSSTFTWDFASTNCGRIISIYFDYYTGVIVFCLLTCMDFSSFYQLRKMNQAVSQGQSGTFRSGRRKIEQRFFIQTVIQGSIFFYELFNFYYLSSLNADRLYVYFTSTFAWEICHALDGLVVLTFHFRGAFCRRSGPKSNIVVSTASASQM